MRRATSAVVRGAAGLALLLGVATCRPQSRLNAGAAAAPSSSAAPNAAAIPASSATAALAAGAELVGAGGAARAERAGIAAASGAAELEGAAAAPSFAGEGGRQAATPSSSASPAAPRVTAEVAPLMVDPSRSGTRCRRR